MSPRMILTHKQNGFLSVCYGNEVYKRPSLNIAVNTLGIWTDSSCAQWYKLSETEEETVWQVTFAKVPLIQHWHFKPAADGAIQWHVDMTVEEWLCIDEIRVLLFCDYRYTQWFADTVEMPFPYPTDQWTELPVAAGQVSHVGVHTFLTNKNIPGYAFEVHDMDLLPFVQVPPREQLACIIGWRAIYNEDRHLIGPGTYPCFSGTIHAFNDISYIHQRIASRNIAGQNTHERIMLANMPWQRDGQWGIRAGSRWPHIKDPSEGDYLPFPFFLAYSMALLEQARIPAFIVDAIAEQMSEEIFLERLQALGITILVAEISIPSLNDDCALLEKIHARGIRVVVCGPVPRIEDEEFLRSHPFIEYVLYGEYEYALRALMQALCCGGDHTSVPGLIYRADGRIVKNTLGEPFDINQLPWPHRATLPMHAYLDAPGEMAAPSVQILASRGCPYRCTFCLWPQVVYHGNHYRARDVKDVVDEMEYLVREKGFKSVYFDDDTFNVGKERMLAFCAEIKARGLHTAEWAIMARADLMDEEILQAMKDAGLWAIKYGVESATQTLLDTIEKGMDLEKTKRMIIRTKELGIRIHLTFTFGLPGETKESMEKTTACALALDPYSVQFSIMTPFPGTRYYTYLKEKGHIVSENYDDYDGHFKSVIRTECLSPEDLEQAKEHACRVWDEHVRKRCDVLFMQCPPWDVSMPPLSIAYLASYLKECVYSVSVYDLNVALYHAAPPDKRELWEQKSYDEWFDDERFSQHWEALQQPLRTMLTAVLREKKPKCIGISVTIASKSFARKVLEVIRELDPAVKVLLGGWGCIDGYGRSLYPPDLVDVFVVGEGEQTVRELLDGYFRDHAFSPVPGAVINDSYKERFVPRPPIHDLDKIPWPRFAEFDLSLYTTKVLPLFTSRGCIGHCSFCNDWAVSRPYRHRSAENIFDEIHYHVTHNHISVFSFKDLLCNGNMHELERLCDRIISHRLTIHWDSQAIARKEMTLPVLNKLKRAGCETLIYGIESFSNSVLRGMKKLFTAEVCEQVIRDTHAAGIQVLFNIIVGFPGETEEHFQETVAMIKQNREFITAIGAVSTCLVNGQSELDLHTEVYGIVMPDDPCIRAKQWTSTDGANTYDVRQRRAREVMGLIHELGLSFETVTM